MMLPGAVRSRRPPTGIGIQARQTANPFFDQALAAGGQGGVPKQHRGRRDRGGGAAQ